MSTRTSNATKSANAATATIRTRGKATGKGKSTTKSKATAASKPTVQKQVSLTFDLHEKQPKNSVRFVETGDPQLIPSPYVSAEQLAAVFGDNVVGLKMVVSPIYG